MRMSPFEISMLLHYYSSPEPFPRHSTELAGQVRKEWLNMGIIQPVEFDKQGMMRMLDAVRQDKDWLYYHTTDLGKIWVEKLVSVKPPAFADYSKLDNAVMVVDKLCGKFLLFRAETTTWSFKDEMSRATLFNDEAADHAIRTIRNKVNRGYAREEPIRHLVKVQVNVAVLKEIPCEV